MRFDTEQTLKDSALELVTSTVPRSEHHLGYLIQVRRTGRVTWGEVSSHKPTSFRTLDHVMVLDLASMIETDDLIAIGFTYSIGEPHDRLTQLYRLTPRYIVREHHRHGQWSAAHRLNERNSHGIELLLLAVHRLLEGRVVNETD